MMESTESSHSIVLLAPPPSKQYNQCCCINVEPCCLWWFFHSYCGMSDSYSGCCCPGCLILTCKHDCFHKTHDYDCCCCTFIFEKK